MRHTPHQKDWLSHGTNSNLVKLLFHPDVLMFKSVSVNMRHSAICFIHFMHELARIYFLKHEYVPALLDI